MQKLLTAERRNQIAELILSNGSFKVGELAKTFNVSTETIRKDLIYLDKKGIITKSHGGATSTLQLTEKPLADRNSEMSEAKLAIAQMALNYIPEHAVIFLDAGSTVLCLAKLLALRSGLTIFTNSLSAANALAGSNNTLHMSGGQLNITTMALEGYGATSFLSKIHVDMAFLGSSGFKDHKGPTSIDFTDAEVKRVMIRNSQQTFVLADGKKAYSTAMVEYASWKSIDYLITDHELKIDDYKALAPNLDIVQI